MNQDRFFQYLQFEKRYAKHTLTAYQSDLKQFFDFIEKTYTLTSASEVQHYHVRSWMVDLMASGITSRSVNRKLSCLKTYFRFLRRNKKIDRNPMAKVIAPKSGKRLPAFVTENSMSLLFEQVDFGEGISGARNQLIMEILYCTGIRSSELIGLKIADVDLAAMQLRIFGKGRKERLAPIARHLCELIEKYLKERLLAFPGTTNLDLFLTNKGEPLSRSFVYNLVKRYLSTVTTIEQRSPHVLRHTFATHLSNNGADLNAIKELLGHSSLAATQVYMHNTIDKLRKVYEQAHPKAKITP